MINFDNNFVEVSTIDQAWRESMWLCIKNGYDFVVEGGSYQGQIRKQLPFVTIKIKEPWMRPLSPIMPASLPAPTTDEKIISYFLNYLMSGELALNEVYKYGTFITQQWERIIDLLVKSGGNTNQATMVIGDVSTTFLDDPPCLRSIDYKIIAGKLQTTIYFRSWDLYAGLPENLGGLQMLSELLVSTLQQTGLDVDEGCLIAFSSGLHLYEQYFPMVDCLNVEKIQIESAALNHKRKYIEIHGE